MTTQIINVDAFDYGAGTFAVRLRDPDDLSVTVATAATVVASANVAARYIATFSTLVAGGVYYLEFVVNGAIYPQWVTLAGVDLEEAESRNERAAILLTATQASIATIETSTTTTIPALINSLTSQSSWGPVERSPHDTNPITFSWPVSGATITSYASIDNAAYGATTGAVSFLWTEGSLHYYSLSFNAADRPTAEGTARYKLADGTYTQYVTLRVEGASTDAAGIRSAVGLASANLDSQLGTIQADTDDLQTSIGVAGAGLTDLGGMSTGMKAEVNTEVLDVISVDTFAELASPPAATSSLKDKITWLFQWMRNKSTETATERKLYADDTTTVISTSTVGDDGTTFTKDEEA
tara:strand:- start:794 stop:1852 length:1059 start_codon:yes stop_codon:yes gene_type:complete